MITPKTVSEQMLFSTVRIKTNLGLGTGFFFRYKVNEQSFLPMIITNNHVIKGATTGSFLCHLGKKEGDELVPLDQSHEFSFANIEGNWHSHPDPKIDLCGMPVGPLFEAATKNKSHIYFKDLRENIIQTDSELENLSAVEDVLMVGYPIGLWDEKNNLPIIRKGITASHPGIDFNGVSHGVIDIASFPGSSGSPILIVNEGAYTRKGTQTQGGGTVLGGRIILLGVLWGGPVHKQNGELEIIEIPTQEKPIPTTNIPIHLGYYIKSKEILTLCKHIAKIFKLI